jgi:serine/threonine protein kinase
LSPGTRLDEFEIVRVLGAGGFGIVYLARDHVLQRDVAIKEYMPAALARRGDGVTVSLRSAGFAETFAKGSNRFSARRGSSPASITGRWSRCTASGAATQRPTWRCSTTAAKP